MQSNEVGCNDNDVATGRNAVKIEAVVEVRLGVLLATNCLIEETTAASGG